MVILLEGKAAIIIIPIGSWKQVADRGRIEVVKKTCDDEFPHFPCPTSALLYSLSIGATSGRQIIHLDPLDPSDPGSGWKVKSLDRIWPASLYTLYRIVAPLQPWRTRRIDLTGRRKKRRSIQGVRRHPPTPIVSFTNAMQRYKPQSLRFRQTWSLAEASCALTRCTRFLAIIAKLVLTDIQVKEKRLHVPLVDRLPEEAPPVIVAVVGPPGVRSIHSITFNYTEGA